MKALMYRGKIILPNDNNFSILFLEALGEERQSVNLLIHKYNEFGPAKDLGFGFYLVIDIDLPIKTKKNIISYINANI